MERKTKFGRLAVSVMSLTVFIALTALVSCRSDKGAGAGGNSVVSSGAASSESCSNASSSLSGDPSETPSGGTDTSFVSSIGGTNSSSHGTPSGSGSGSGSGSDSGRHQKPESILLNNNWKYSENAAIRSGAAVLYRAADGVRKNIVVAVNAGHGTKGGSAVRTKCHPDGSPKCTGGTTAAGNTTAPAVSEGMTFSDGTPESTVTLKAAHILKQALLNEGYDVLMLRDGSDVQLDNVARTVIANNRADCHISLHWDGDGLSYDKGCFYVSVPDGIKGMAPVSSVWREHERLGEALIKGLKSGGARIFGSGSMDIDLTQTAYSTIPSADIELGNACSSHDDNTLLKLCRGLVKGICDYFGG